MGGIVSTKKENHYEIGEVPLLLHIPNEVIEWMLSYLHLSEVLRFDSSMTNHHYRKHWLQILHRRISPFYRPEKVFTVPFETIVRVMTISHNRIISISWSQSGRYSEAWTIRVWNAHGDTAKELKGHTSTILNVFEVNENCLFSTSHDGTFRVWNLEIAECERFYENGVSFDGLKFYPEATIYLGDGKILSRTVSLEFPCGSSEFILWNIYEEGKRISVGTDFGQFILLPNYWKDHIPRLLSQSKETLSLQIWNCLSYQCEKEMIESERIQEFLLFSSLSHHLPPPAATAHSHQPRRSYDHLAQLITVPEDASTSHMIDPRVLVVIRSDVVCLKIWNMLTAECLSVVEFPGSHLGYRTWILRPTPRRSSIAHPHHHHHHHHAHSSNPHEHGEHNDHKNLQEQNEQKEEHHDHPAAHQQYDHHSHETNHHSKNQSNPPPTHPPQHQHQHLHDLRDYVVVFGELRSTSNNDLHAFHLSDQSLLALPHPPGIPHQLLAIQPLHSTGRVITCSSDKTARIFNVLTGQCERRLNGGRVSSVEEVFTDDHSRMVTNYDDHHCILWKAVKH